MSTLALYHANFWLLLSISQKNTQAEISEKISKHISRNDKPFFDISACLVIITFEEMSSTSV